MLEFECITGINFGNTHTPVCHKKQKQKENKEKEKEEKTVKMLSSTK